MKGNTILKNIMSRLSALPDEANERKAEPLSDGEICAWNCISDSLQNRISYLNEFNDESIECRLIECKLELDGIISVLEGDIAEAGSSVFDNDFKLTLNEALVELNNIRGSFC